MRSKIMGPYFDYQVGRFEPPDPAREHDILLARARRARAEATTDLLGALFAGVRAAAKAAAGFVRHTGTGAGLMPPRGDDRHPGPAGLTGCCQ